jgi:hypothetical protein
VQDTLSQCKLGAPTDPTCGGVITRKADGTIESISIAYRNLASYKTRGLDIEGSHRTRVGDGTVTARVVANHVFDLLVNGVDAAGVVGGDTAFSTPKWRVTGALSYSDAGFGADLRARYVAGGIYSATLRGANGKPILNNDISSRTYFDFGMQFKVNQFTLFGNVNNMFDAKPPYTPYTNPNYDVIGRYYSAGVKLKF